MHKLQQPWWSAEAIVSPGSTASQDLQPPDQEKDIPHVEADDDQLEPLSSDARDAQRDEDDSTGRRPSDLDPDEGPRADPPDSQEDSPDDPKQALARLEGGENEELSDADRHVIDLAMVAAQVAIERSESFSGLLPAPKDWDQYGHQWHERIMRMSESFTTDESARRDRLVDAALAETPKSRRTAAVLAVLAMVLAFLTGVIFDQRWVAVAFLALPVMLMIQSFLPDRQNRSSKDRSIENGDSAR